MMIECPECRKEISDKADKCPNCGCPITTTNEKVKNAKGEKEEKKKDSALSIWACVLAIFTCTIPVAFILALVDICMNDKTKRHRGSWFAIVMSVLAFVVFLSATGNEKENQTVDVSVTTEQKTETEEKTEEKTNEITTGKSFEKDGLKVTIDDISTDFKDYDESFEKPEDGKKYIMVSFTFENSGETDAYVDIYGFECYADDTSCEQAYLSAGGDFVNTNLSKGRNVSFSTYYTVPEDAKSIELEYTADFWTEEKVIIKVQ